MADTALAGGRAQQFVPPNRASTRSTRKKKTAMLSPKKFIDFVNGKTKSGSFEAGIAELYKECYLETPTFSNYFKEANKEKNFSKNVWLYDSTRVVVPDVPYYHASWVDGLKPNQYVLAQAPMSAGDQKDFLKLLAHVKADGLIVADGSEDVANVLAAKFERAGKKSCEKSSAGEDVTYATMSGEGLKGLKTVRFTHWTDSISAAELIEMLEKARKHLGSPTKGPIVITCKDGATKCGIVAFLDIEANRLEKTKRAKHTDTMKHIRLMRSNTFDTFENFDLAANSIIELCSKKKK